MDMTANFVICIGLPIKTCFILPSLLKVVKATSPLLQVYVGTNTI